MLNAPSEVAAQTGLTPPRLWVNEDGTIEELDDGRGVRMVLGYSILLHYARNLLASGRDLVRFIWIDPGESWHSVTIEASATSDGRRAAMSMLPCAPPFALTKRELDVLTLIAGGLGNQEIADTLQTRLRTITTHVERILEKMDQVSRAGLAALAVERGLLRLPLPGGGGGMSSLTIGQVNGPARPARPSRGAKIRLRPIQIGAPLSLSGFASADAQEMLNGATLAVDEINRRGGVAGRGVELCVVDCDVSDPVAVEAAYKSLIDREVDAITTGYTCVEERTQDLVADYGAPYLHCVTMEAMVERVRQDPARLRNVFQAGPSDIHYGPEFMRFITGLEARGQWRPRNRRAIVIQPSWSKMDIGLQAMDALACQHGWKVEIVDGLPLSGIDWRQVMSRVHGCDPSAILLAYYFPEESIAFQRSFLADPLDTLVYCLYSPSIPVYRQALGDGAEGVLWATSTGTYSDLVGQRFARRYANLHGRPPGRAHAGLAYDRVNMLATAWARASNPRAFGKVIAELRDVVHRGVNGSYALDNDRQCGLSYPHTSADPSLSLAHLVFQVQQARNVILAPDPYADGAFRQPPWFADR